MSNPDEKTRLIRKATPDAACQPPASNNYRGPGNDDDPEKTIYQGTPNPQHAAPPGSTRIIRRDDPVPQSPVPAAGDDGKTILVRPSSRNAPASGAATPDSLPEGPVVGWLVVVEGPGRGKSVPLGYGMNPIGRESGNRVALPFGDDQISRVKHATLTFDPRGRRFFIQHGESSNLTYLGEMPVLAPMEIKSGDHIRIGDHTVLRFVALCGTDFNWDTETNPA